MTEIAEGRIRARETLELLLARGLEQWQVLQKMRFALANGIVRCRVQFAVVGADEFRDWDAPRSIWAASIMNSTLSLRLDEYSADPGATPAHPGKVMLAGLAFDLEDMRTFFEIDQSELPQPAPAKPSRNVKHDRGRLPETAKPADRRDEEYAHQAAALVRRGLKLSDALRQVAPTDLTRSETSIEHGIRRTFNLMYHADGRAILP